MKDAFVLYEYPFNERTRTYLRLEAMFYRLSILIGRTDPIDHHYAIVSIFEVMDIAARVDLKSDIIKEFDRQKLLLNSYKGNPSIQEGLLSNILAKIDQAYSELSEQSGKTGSSLINNDFLMSIRSRIGIPGGTCGFDLPAYHAWQHKESAYRQEAVRKWAASLEPLAKAVHLLLQLLRDAGAPKKMIAHNGHYQQSLHQNKSFQMMRLHLSSNKNIVPEISGNRLIISIRMMESDDSGRLQNTLLDTDFELTLC